MSLDHILILILAALIIRLLAGRFNNVWMLYAASIIGVYWLQSPLPIRYLDFWLPTATLGFTLTSWALTSREGETNTRENRVAFFLLAGIVLLVASTRYFSLSGILSASRPPQSWEVGLVLVFAALLTSIIIWNKSRCQLCIPLMFFAITALLIILKLPEAAKVASEMLRSISGQSVELAKAGDLRWLGYSYIAFRLIHTLRDRQTGRLPSVSLAEYIVYVLFFPAITAGPIDRLPRFLKDLRADGGGVANLRDDIQVSARRLLLGMFKKFVLADTLALIALSPQNAHQVNSRGWLWVLVYAYSFQIFLDFSGYTDIAIGLGRVLGIKLPENFKQPYLKTNLTKFWNSWHITLTQWIRGYFFNPLTRTLRRSRSGIPVWAIIFISQMSTMSLIGLWHGVTWNFLIWGLWHGAGLFVQNRWTEWSKPFTVKLNNKPLQKSVSNGIGVLLTFHFVSLGWVWFALSDVETSVSVFLKLITPGGQ